MTYEQVKEYNEKIHKEIDKLNVELNSMSDEEYVAKREEYRTKIDNLFGQLEHGKDITENDFNDFDVPVTEEERKIVIAAVNAVFGG